VCSRLTKKAEPPPTRGVNRDSGTEGVNGGWLRRSVRRLGFKKQVRQALWVKYHQLSTEERYEIAAMRRQRMRLAEMARHLGRHRSTLYREVKRNQSVHDGHYRPTHAMEKASGRARRSRRNWRHGPAEFAPIEAMLREGFSPEQIVGRRKREGQRVMSHETIIREFPHSTRLFDSIKQDFWRNFPCRCNILASDGYSAGEKRQRRAQGARIASTMPWTIFLSAGTIVASTPPSCGRAESPSPETK
jgi:hypothetical protein